MMIADVQATSDSGRANNMLGWPPGRQFGEDRCERPAFAEPRRFVTVPYVGQASSDFQKTILSSSGP
jgi:hypothetical protein